MATLGTFATTKVEEPAIEKDEASGGEIAPEGKTSTEDETLEADITEEDDAGEGFDNEELRGHAEEELGGEERSTE